MVLAAPEDKEQLQMSFKKTPCYLCQRPERLPNGLCEKGCKVKADYMAERAEYEKQRSVQFGLTEHSIHVAERIRKKTKHKYGGLG